MQLAKYRFKIKQNKMKILWYSQPAFFRTQKIMQSKRKETRKSRTHNFEDTYRKYNYITDSSKKNTVSKSDPYYKL